GGRGEGLAEERLGPGGEPDPVVGPPDGVEEARLHERLRRELVADARDALVEEAAYVEAVHRLLTEGVGRDEEAFEEGDGGLGVVAGAGRLALLEREGDGEGDEQRRSEEHTS